MKMYTRLIGLGFPAAALLVGVTTALFFFVDQVQAQRWGTGPFRTVICNNGEQLQTAIDTSTPGTSISVTGLCDAGPYFIDKDLSLRGFEDAVTGELPVLSSVAGSGHVLHIVGATVILFDLTIDAVGVTSGLVTTGAQVHAQNVVVKNAPGGGINVSGSSHLAIVDSEIRDNGRGVNVGTSSAASIIGSSLHDNTDAIGVNFNSSAVVDSNTIDFNDIGLVVSKMSSIAVKGNTIENNTSKGVYVAHQYAFLETFSPPNTIQNNGVDVQCNDKGIFESALPQISSTALTAISAGCTVLGTIF